VSHLAVPVAGGNRKIPTRPRLRTKACMVFRIGTLESIMTRTSHSHPLRIDSVICNDGVIGLTFAPGKCSSSIFGADWQRSLEVDLDAVCEWGADMVVTLLEAEEMVDLSIPDLGAGVKARDMIWLHLPIPDGEAPNAEWWALWRDSSLAAHQIFDKGGRVLVHCRGGLERAACIAALIQIERGVSLPQSLLHIGKARPGAAPLPAQSGFLSRACKGSGCRVGGGGPLRISRGSGTGCASW